MCSAYLTAPTSGDARVTGAAVAHDAAGARRDGPPPRGEATGEVRA